MHKWKRPKYPPNGRGWIKSAQSGEREGCAIFRHTGPPGCVFRSKNTKNRDVQNRLMSYKWRECISACAFTYISTRNNKNPTFDEHFTYEWREQKSQISESNFVKNKTKQKNLSCLNKRPKEKRLRRIFFFKWLETQYFDFIAWKKNCSPSSKLPLGHLSAPSAAVFKNRGTLTE